MAIKIATWNVNGIRAREKELIGWLRAERPDVLCLQEIKAAPEQIPGMVFEAEGYWCYWHGGKGYSGVGLLLRKECAPTRPAFTHPEFDYEHRIAVTVLGSLSIASVYVPNGGKDFAAKMKFLEAMEQYARSHAAGPGHLVLCGDMNVAHTDMDVSPKERKASAIGQRPDERELFSRILSTGLTDVGRALDPNNDQLFTWWAPWRGLRERNIGWRIDYILTSAAFANKATLCRSYREVGTSDHAPVVAVFDS